MHYPEHDDRQVHRRPATHLVRAVAKLSHRERMRFERALEVLEGGGAAVALAQAGIVVTGLGIFEALLARCWAVRHTDPGEMFKLANAAVEVAAHLNPRYGVRFVADLQARAWGELANACRVAGRLEDAASAFKRAVDFSSKGTGNRLLWAWLLDLNATRHGCARNLALAVETLEVCRQLYEELGESHLAGRTLLTQAVFVFAGGEAARALRLNEGGRFLLDPAREPGLLTQAARNQWIFEAALSQR